MLDFEAMLPKIKFRTLSMATVYVAVGQKWVFILEPQLMERRTKTCGPLVL